MTDTRQLWLVECKNCGHTFYDKIEGKIKLKDWLKAKLRLLTNYKCPICGSRNNVRAIKKVTKLIRSK